MKKTNKSNPLKTFNDNKAMAYKKAGGEMAAYKKSLIKANDGKIVGPQTEQQAKMSAMMNYQPPIPQANLPSPYADIPRAASIQGSTARSIADSMAKVPGTFKNGGSTKRKK
jgi:hypothetical protein